MVRKVDAYGMMSGAGALARAGAAALADGPFPIGDLIGLGILLIYISSLEWCPLEDQHNMGPAVGFRCEFWCRKSGRIYVDYVPYCEGGCPAGRIG